MSLPEFYQPFLDLGVFEWIAPYSTELILRSYKEGEEYVETPEPLKFAFAMLLQASIYGHTALNLEAVSEQLALIEHLDVRRNTASYQAYKAFLEQLPKSLDVWKEWLFASPFVYSLTDQKSDLYGEKLIKPFILDQSYLVTQRYFKYVTIVQHFIEQRVDKLVEDIDYPALRNDMRDLFGELNPQDNQILGTLSALLTRFCVIAGGPGTGKTFTVKKILIAFYRDWMRRHQRPPVVAIAAPTGKAAVRVQQLLYKDLDNHSLFPIDDDTKHWLQSIIPTTLHKLLKYNWNNHTRFLLNAKNPIVADMVIVDEASMVDLPMMAHLMDAIHDNTRLILLGDKNQLASVEAGTVLSDIIDDPRAHLKTHALVQCYNTFFESSDRFNEDPNAIPLSDSIVVFDKPYRMKEDSGIQTVAYAMIHDEPDRVIEAFSQKASMTNDEKSFAFNDLSIYPHRKDILSKEIETLLMDEWLGPNSYLQMLMTGPKEGQSVEAHHLEVLERFSQFGLLAPYREKRFGVALLNAWIESFILKNIGQSKYHVGRRYDDLHWVGMPILMNENVYDLGIMNGDIGIVVHMPDLTFPKGVCVVFPGVDGVPRYLSLAQLPKHETVFAMTVHKSQGSEFNHLLFVLPSFKGALLTRELVYTAVTRARQKLTIAGDLDVLKWAMQNRMIRTSNLRQRLWE